MVLQFASVYGPVQSWRFGRSLGIDPIGSRSTCSFDCVYCQLGAIEHVSQERRVFIPTSQILQDLQAFAPWDVDVITLSGSGEPTLAQNLDEILNTVKALTHKPLVVLTNGTLLNDATVRSALALADQVAIKLDAVTPDQLRRINRPIKGIHLPDILTGLQQFRETYPDHILAVQTMLLAPWDEETQRIYIQWMQTLGPDEIQLNTPTRPKPIQHYLEARGNHLLAHQSPDSPYAVQSLKCLSTSAIAAFATQIQQSTGIPVRYPPQGE